VIIGTSQAAVQLCVSLRQEGWKMDILIIGDDRIYLIIAHTVKDIVGQ